MFVKLTICTSFCLLSEQAAFFCLSLFNLNLLFQSILPYYTSSTTPFLLMLSCPLLRFSFTSHLPQDFLIFFSISCHLLGFLLFAHLAELHHIPDTPLPSFLVELSPPTFHPSLLFIFSPPIIASGLRTSSQMRFRGLGPCAFHRSQTGVIYCRLHAGMNHLCF